MEHCRQRGIMKAPPKALRELAERVLAQERAWGSVFPSGLSRHVTLDVPVSPTVIYRDMSCLSGWTA